MFTIISYSGVATAQLDMTAALTPLGIGLLSLLMLSAGMIIWSACRSGRREIGGETTTVAASPQEQKMAA